jgi:hypothetical protein
MAALRAQIGGRAFLKQEKAPLLLRSARREQHHHAHWRAVRKRRQ